MAEELFQGSLSGYNNTTWNSMRCNDIFSCSAAVNDGDAGGSFGYFPATATDIFEQLCYNSSSFDDISPQFSTPADWSQSFPESPETNNFYADFLHERPTTEQYSQVEDTSEGLFLSQDENVTGSAMDDHDHSCYNIPSPLELSSDGSLRWSTTARIMPPYVISNANPTEMSNWAAVRDSMLPIITKKFRVEPPSPLPTFKVRKEKLGDRITALQQLVSPFGKTDTASVLHEAINYIKFLHEEVTGLSNAYPRDAHQTKANRQNILGRKKTEEESMQKDLRSRGLCLVPISSTFEMAGNEIPPFDFWTQLWRKL